MLDPRIYRMSLVIAALGLIVLAFSLTDQPGGARPTLAPSAFDGQSAFATMTRLAKRYPARSPGSSADRAVANEVARTLGSSQDAFNVTRDRFSERTADGTHTIEDVIASRVGTEPGAIVIVAPRDGVKGSAAQSLSGTATLLELGRDLAGETLQRTVVLVSTSASVGNAGAVRLAATLPRPIDAVVVLGDLISSGRHQPVVIPWSTNATLAPSLLRNTITSALATEHATRATIPGTLAQLAHLAFPLTISPQGPFAAAGIPAVEISLSGERGPQSGAAIAGAAALGAVGRSVLATTSALDAAPALAAPSRYVLFDGKVVPGWALSLFVLTLIVPVLTTTIDGLARAGRRGYPLVHSLVAVLSAALPFVVAALVVLLGRLVGLVPEATPAPAPPGSIGVGAGAIAVMAVAGLAALLAALVARHAFASLAAATSPRATKDSRARAVDRSGDGAAIAMLVVACVAAVLIWLQDPLAAALLVPALHLWLWAVDSDLPLPLPARLAMLAAGALPVALIVVYYANTLGFTPWGVAWEAVLLIAGQVVGLGPTVCWSLVLGCLAGGVAAVVATARRPVQTAPAQVSVRGPVTYSGPGSLGGTKSALRR